jgi:hypothetical protein
MPTIDASVGGAASNSYETQAEANTYFDERLALVPPWLVSGQDNVAALIMATRVLDAYAQPKRTFIPGLPGDPGYFRIRPQWTGAPATAMQKLAWPRTGLFDRNGNAIPSDVIPQELKDAESEMAGQLLAGDRTLDNSVIVQGITSLRAGPVSLSFRNGVFPQVLPDAVLDLMPPSWFTDEAIEGAYGGAQFEVL